MLRRYELSVAAQLDALSDEISRNAEILEHASIKDRHHDCIDSIKAAAVQWGMTIEPLQIYARTIGTDSVTGGYEAKLFNVLSACGIILRQQEAIIEAAAILHIEYNLIEQSGKYDKLSKSISEVLAVLDQAYNEQEQKKLDEYARLSEQAWREEQHRNDEAARQRAKEAAANARKQNAKARQQREADEDIRLFRLRYEQLKLEEKKRQEKENEQRSLLSQKSELQEKRKKLGIFSKKKKRQLDVAISDIDKKLTDL